MIESIGIEFFQSHKYTFIYFDKGVNVITGPSDNGKSSIIKAIEWCRNNRPSGEDFKSWFARKMDQVAVEISTNGKSVALMRNDNKNTYYDGKYTYAALKTDIPKEVSDILNLADYNVQTQFQPYFLLQDAPGEVARKLDELVGLDVIDTLYKNLASEIRTANNTIFLMKTEIADCGEALKEYEHLDKIDILISNLEQNSQKLSEIRSTVNFLEEIKQSLESIQSERYNANLTVKAEKEVNTLLDNCSKLTNLQYQINSLETSLENIKELENEKEENNAWLEVEPLCTKIVNNLTLQNEVTNNIKNLETYLNKLNSIDSQRKREISMKEETTEKYLSLLEKENVCPIINSPFQKICLTKLKEGL